MRAFLFALALFATAGAAHAEDRFTLDPAHTQVAFSIDRMGFNRVLGRFDAIAGEVIIDQAAPERSSVTATIQTASLTSGNATRDEHLKSDRWLNVAAHPTMEFRSTSVRVIEENHAEVVGNLTLMGQTHPVTLDVRLNQIGAGRNGGQQAGFSATGTIQRSQFGLTTAVPAIGDAVTIEIQALATTPAPQ